MLELFYKRRSIRKYKDIKVEEEKIEKLIEAALLSPSGRSRKPWSFVVVENEELLEKLSKSKEHGSELIEKAPLAIVVCGDEKVSDTWVEDTSIALTFIQLEAESLGLGSCWVQIRERKTKDGEKSESYVKNLLGIDKNFRVEAIVAIGYPDELKAPYIKEALNYEKVTRIK